MTAIFTRAAELPTLPFPLVALDTETELFTPPTYALSRKTRHTPFRFPRLLFGQLAHGNTIRVLRGHNVCSTVRELLQKAPQVHFCFHNAVFDISVLCLADPSLRPLFIRAVDEGRVHDTQILEQLLQIARGSQAIDQKVIKSHTLADLAARRAGMKLNKSEDIRLNFAAYADPAFPPPESFLNYAADDAEATYRVFASQHKELLFYANHVAASQHPILAHARDIFGPLTETVQVKGALALAWLEQFPVRVDLQQVEAIRTRLCAEARLLEDALISFGWAKRTPKSRKFGTSHKTLRSVLGNYAADQGIIAPRSDSGLVSLAYDFWSKILPAPDPELRARPGAASDLEGKASVWLHYQRVQKLLSTYISPYSTNAEHYPTYYNLGARTGRTSSSRPNIQNVPKHKWGIRSLFIPRPGFKLVEGDFKAAELVALAQTYHLRFGGSLLGDAINAGKDPHIETARRLEPTFDSQPEDQRKKLRQAAKAINFGLPGGLGASKFQLYANKSYGLTLTEEQAKALRNTALEADPELRAYLSDGRNPHNYLLLAAANLNLSLPSLITALGSWRIEEESIPHYDLACARLRKWSFGDDRFDIPTPPGFNRRYDLTRTDAVSPVGFLRGRCSYTEAHNLPFQNLVSCGAKLAAWNLFKAWSPDASWQPVAFIHDSFVIDTNNPTQDSETLRTCMIDGLKAVCPDIRVEVDVTEPLDRWGKTTL